MALSIASKCQVLKTNNIPIREISHFKHYENIAISSKNLVEFTKITELLLNGFIVENKYCFHPRSCPFIKVIMINAKWSHNPIKQCLSVGTWRSPFVKTKCFGKQYVFINSMTYNEILEKFQTMNYIFNALNTAFVQLHISFTSTLQYKQYKLLSVLSKNAIKQQKKKTCFRSWTSIVM